MSRGCHLMVYGQKHANINCSKVQINLLYKMTFLIFDGSYHWNLLIKIPQWETPGMALTIYIICYQMHIVFIIKKNK